MAEQDQLYLVRKAPRDMSRLRRYEGITRYEALDKIEIGQSIAEGEGMAQALVLLMVLEDEEDDMEVDDENNQIYEMMLLGVVGQLDQQRNRLFDLS